MTAMRHQERQHRILRQVRIGPVEEVRDGLGVVDDRLRGLILVPIFVVERGLHVLLDAAPVAGKQLEEPIGALLKGMTASAMARAFSTTCASAAVAAPESSRLAARTTERTQKMWFVHRSRMAS